MTIATLSFIEISACCYSVEWYDQSRATGNEIEDATISGAHAMLGSCL